MIVRSDVAVIGSGFSAAAVTVNLLDRLPPNLKISLVGNQENPCRGTAYATPSNSHLLNVPAARMGLYPDRPDHFQSWLEERGMAFGSEDFVPRNLYGAYLQDVFEEALHRTGNRAAVSRIDARVVGGEAGKDGQQVYRLSDGRTLIAKASALCTGATAAGIPLPKGAIAAEALPHIVEDPWSEPWQQRVPLDGTVLILGTGLTMVDQCLSLRKRGFVGKIHAISRRGLLPQTHVVPRPAPVEAFLSPGELELSAMLAWLRQRAENAADWRGVIDGLRPVTQDLWKGLTAEQRSRFLRHAAPFWNSHRHRMAPAVSAELGRMRESGDLMIDRGRLIGVEPREGSLRAIFSVAATGERRSIDAHILVNCTGIERCSVKQSDLLTDMASKGLVRCDPLGLGLDVDDRSAVVSGDGSVSGRLYAMGAMTLGRFWEITAVPDIRVQAGAVAKSISEVLAA
ncbi:FAD/NAD(P)-binding protein [Sinorhizobium sp. BG8]|uniref:FAD/NAD(P)-binding protein n=1 Tax=Sinorhizobium sp. BG8 TaxID=2613773 RepID=UPI00193DF231|nr:FAD/NAD(P)-binding protein [Sinorhizobium sp. BG8]QRM53703.1 FAD-dependent pyridine nucleotide-disulfide oxidoreductase [Sinorhizobium sp. BG8]